MTRTWYPQASLLGACIYMPHLRILEATFGIISLTTCALYKDTYIYVCIWASGLTVSSIEPSIGIKILITCSLDITTNLLYIFH